MKAYWRYVILYHVRRHVENFWIRLAWRVPRKLRYWCTMVSGIEATTGEWSHEEVPAVLFVDVLQRIDK